MATQIETGGKNTLTHADYENSLNVLVAMANNSSSTQPSLEDVPDFLNCSYDTLHKLAALSNHDDFIYGN